MNVLKNQAQINAAGHKASDWHYEVSSRTSTADPARLRDNNPDAIIEVLNLDTGQLNIYKPGDFIPPRAKP
jgi:hypothetical protein